MTTPCFRLRSFQVPAWLALCLVALCVSAARAEDGYRLWLRYDQIPDGSLRQAYATAITEIVVPAAPDRPAWAGATINAARDELVTGLRGLFGSDVPVVDAPSRAGSLLLANPRPQ